MTSMTNYPEQVQLNCCRNLASEASAQARRNLRKSHRARLLKILARPVQKLHIGAFGRMFLGCGPAERVHSTRGLVKHHQGRVSCKEYPGSMRVRLYH